MGTEVVGVLEFVGPGLTDFKAGDHFCYASGPVLAACAAHRKHPASRLLHAPARVKDGEIAASLLKGMLVEYLIQRCHAAKKAEQVLMHAVARGVGLLAGQWGHHLGPNMIGAVTGEEKVKLALANGYAHCFDRIKVDIPARKKEITGGESVVYDTDRKNSFDQSLNSLAPRGFFGSFSTTTGAPQPVAVSTLQKNGSLYFTRPTLVPYTDSKKDLRHSAG